MHRLICARVLSVLAILLTLTGPGLSDDLSDREGWEVYPTTQDFDGLLARLKAAVGDEGMALVTQASASEGAAGRGVTIPGNTLVGVYRNDFAVRMLEASIAAGIEAPIRFYVTENPDGSATLSWKTPSFVFGPYMEEGDDRLKDLATELDVIFQAIADRAVADR